MTRLELSGGSFFLCMRFGGGKGARAWPLGLRGSANASLRGFIRWRSLRSRAIAPVSLIGGGLIRQALQCPCAAPVGAKGWGLGHIRSNLGGF